MLQNFIIYRINFNYKLEGGLYPGGGIIGSIYLFTGRWGYNRGELISAGGWLALYCQY